MTTSDGIAALSFLAAILAAVYARWAVGQAERQNEISIHNEKLKIYRGFLNFRFELKQRPIDFTLTSLVDFDKHVQLSEFYFDNQFYQSLHQFAELAVETYSARDFYHALAKDGFLNSDHKKEADLKNNLAIENSKKLSALHSKIDEEFKRRLRLVAVQT